MRIKTVGNLADKVVVNIVNGETTASIPRGTPVILKSVSTGSVPATDGLHVVLPATAGDVNSYGLRFGVSVDTLAAAAAGESILFGVCLYAIIVLSTRSTPGTGGASWSTVSQASGAGLAVDTLNNAFLIGGTIAASIASNAMMAILMDSMTMTASATHTSDTSTAFTKSARVFVRML